MKAEELRVGNIVFVDKNEELCGTPMVIKGISCNEMYGKHYAMIYKHGSDRLSCTYYPMIHTVRPIPLTEEILLRCGFVNKGYGSLGYVFARSLSCCITKSGDYFAFRVNTISVANVFIREIKYLHELQNLYYAITGEELKINLL